MIFTTMLRLLLLSFVLASLVLAIPDIFTLSELDSPIDDTPNLVTFDHSLLRRQTSFDSHPDYTCGPDQPCQNEACCGKSNVCGFGKLYCGDGCQSNCDAKAECGREAAIPGTECPLNVCCSQFGFCGTTSEFCDTGCQSNCGAFDTDMENLFPNAADFPIDFDPVFAEAFDHNQDLVPEPPSSQDPNKESFAWINMVGSSADVQSFEKRDGSHLELFDCPDTHPDDFSIQKAKAICLTDFVDNNCEDIMEGGVEGTVVKLPAHCGPDQWVRAVSYKESTDRRLPQHLEKRAKPHHKIYDFHYDYDFGNLRRDGGEVEFRIDASNHPGY